MTIPGCVIVHSLATACCHPVKYGVSLQVMVNWDELIKCSGEFLSSFLVRLRTSGELVRGIGDVLTSQIPNLTPHIRWCSCQLNACLILQQKSSDPKFKEFEAKCLTDPRTGGLPLSSFLLKPMQRVTKYPLLIKRVRGKSCFVAYCYFDITRSWIIPLLPTMTMLT